VSDSDATRKRHRVTDPLRLYADNMYANNLIDGPQLNAMRRIADQIDSEHERRMDQAREDSRKHTCNYMSRIIADYKRGRKWKRKEYE